MAFVVVLALSACRSPETDAPRIPTNAQLDSGNASLTVGDPASALRHYRAATADDEAAAAAWFGVYLANRELGDTIAAAEAISRVQKLVPEAEAVQTLHDPDIAGSHPVTAPHATPRPRP